MSEDNRKAERDAMHSAGGLEGWVRVLMNASAAGVLIALYALLVTQTIPQMQERYMHEIKVEREYFNKLREEERQVWDDRFSRLLDKIDKLAQRLENAIKDNGKTATQKN